MKISVIFALTLAATAVSVQAENLKPAGWVLLPAIGSSPETGFQYGAYVMRQFAQTNLSEPQDRLELLLQGTTKGQFQAFVWPNYFVAGGDWNLTGKVGGKYWPTPYFGQSNDIDFDDTEENYELSTFESEFGAAYRVTPSVRLGGLVFLEHETVDGDDNDPLLNDSILGTDGGLYSGLGVTALWDTRDDRDWPTQGTELSLEYRQYSEALGSDYSFGHLFSTLGHYINIGDDVLALGLNYQWGSEDTPVTRLPRPAGASTLRGADGNRWIDHHLLGTQAEYRLTINDRWAVTGFMDTAQVADTFGDMGFDRFHTSLGGGVRWSTMSASRFNVRFDIGWVDMESIGFAISVGEAF